PPGRDRGVRRPGRRRATPADLRSLLATLAAPIRYRRRMEFSTLTYTSEDRIATITLNRPERLNAINDAMPAEIAAAVDRAEDDDDIHVIVLAGAGRAFCSGYDLKEYAEAEEAPYSQEMPWDPMLDFRLMSRNTS